MDNLNSETYPYSCAHLWYLWHVEKLTGKQILDLTTEMQFWLDNSVGKNFSGSYIWDTNYTLFPLHYNKNFVIFRHVQQVGLANSIKFKAEEDLLAFRLRWGINDNVEM